MEGIGCAAATRRGIGQRIYDLHLLDNRARPSMRDDERQRIFMFRANVNEVNVQSIDLGDELRQGVQSRLHLSPVVFGPVWSKNSSGPDSGSQGIALAYC